MHALLFIMSVAFPPADSPSPSPPYNGPACDTVQESATGFFQVMQLDGRWWFIDPNGRGFYLIGTDHIRYDGHGCQALGYAPYGRHVQEHYASEDAWAESTLKRLKEWGFNTLTAGHSTSLRHKGLPHTEFLAIGTAFARQEALCPPETWTGFPNVFSPEWPAYCEKLAEERCAPHRDDPWLVGYFLDNELEWYGKIWLPYGLFHEAWKLPADHSAKQAWIAFLKSQLEKPSDMTRHWGTSVDGWDELADHTEPHEPMSDDARETALAWVSHVAERYFEPAVKAIRRHDPNHLILGCRFAGPSPGAWPAAGRYCDVVSFNYYPDIDVRRGVPLHVVEMFHEWQQAAKAPMMITEWSFPALDTELPSTHGAGMRVDDQEQRARCFTQFQRTMFRLPFMVGSDFFMYIDEPEQGIAETFPENSNYGLVSNTDQPYEHLTRAAARVNQDACLLRAKDDLRIRTAGQWLVPWLEELPRGVREIPATPMKASVGRMILEGPIEGQAWQLTYGDRQLGQFAILINQLTPHSHWQGSPAVRITALRRDENVTVVDMEMSGIRPDGSADEPSPARAYRAGWRFWIPARPAPGSEGGQVDYFVSQCLWVENTDSEPWTLARVLHSLTPALGGSSDGDEILDMRVQRYHRRGGGWVDPQAGLGVGMWLPAEWQFYYAFWKGDDGTFHTDVRFDPYVTLAPGERYEEPTGRRVFVFPLTRLTRDGFADATRAIDDHAFRLPETE